MKLVHVPKGGAEAGVDDPGKNIIFSQFVPTDVLAAGQNTDHIYRAHYIVERKCYDV